MQDKAIKGSLSFEKDRILSFEEPENVLLEDKDVYVCPGFIDEHIHGANGLDVMDAKISSRRDEGSFRQPRNPCRRRSGTIKDNTIAASVLRLDEGLRNIRGLAKGYSYSNLINLVSLSPARNLHLENEHGSIPLTRKANLIILDK